MNFDVVIVGAGPAGLSAAIRLKQFCLNHSSSSSSSSSQSTDLSVCVVEKGSDIGSHILSGNIFEPRAFDELFPSWRKEGMDGEEEGPLFPLTTAVTEDHFYFLTKTKLLEIPQFFLPKALHNDGNFVVSLGSLCKWLAHKAEELGVEIYSGFSADKIVVEEEGEDKKVVRGVQIADVGISKKGEKKATYQPGMQLLGRQTILAEGCRGSLSEAVMKLFDLRKGVCPQRYGLGVKEIWELEESKFFNAGCVIHTVGWPLGNQTYGGSFIYYMKPNLLLIGMVVGLDYKNPYLSPYSEFQRFKLHPQIQRLLQGGRCISYGARCLNEGGLQAIPKLTFPGGCSAGFLNVLKIKGTHGAMKSGMIAAETTAEALLKTPSSFSSAEETELKAYTENIKKSWVWKELEEVRNLKPSFEFGGLLPGLMYSGFTSHLTKGKEPWTFEWKKSDSEMTEEASKHKPIEYPKPDGHLTFDILENLMRSGTNHEHDQPSHLKVKPHLQGMPDVSFDRFAAPESRFCPAKVYEYIKDENSGKMRFQINAQNCLHCKCCSIKTPSEFIQWDVPEGGGGPNYSGM